MQPQPSLLMQMLLDRTFLLCWLLLAVCPLVCPAFSKVETPKPHASVYCLHGFLRSASSMEPMAQAFRRDGYRACSWGYPSRQGAIQDHAEALVQELQQTARCHPGEPIHFVTHSLGGIVLRAALNHPACPEEAKQGRAVLLSPPNQGTHFGRLLNHLSPLRSVMGDKAGKELFNQPNFDYLGQFPEAMEILVISGTFGWNPFVGGKNDGKVGVQESCLKTHHQHTTAFYGHSWIMYADRVIDTALDFIESDDSKGYSHF